MMIDYEEYLIPMRRRGERKKKNFYDRHISSSPALLITTNYFILTTNIYSLISRGLVSSNDHKHTRVRKKK